MRISSVVNRLEPETPLQTKQAAKQRLCSMAEARRDRFFETWCKLYPGILQTGHDDVSFGPCGDFMQKVMEEELMKEISSSSPPNDTEHSQKNMLKYLGTVGLELEVLRPRFAAVESITKDHPQTWWGDLLNLLTNFRHLTNSEQERLTIRSSLFSKLDLQNVYFCREDGRPTLILEAECLAWGQHILLTLAGSNHFPAEDLAHFPKEQCRKQGFHPKEFVPSVLQLVEYNRISAPEYSRTWHFPLWGLPALFELSPDPQNFDKKTFVSQIQALESTEHRLDGLELVLLFGMYLTWSPSIHPFFSLNDQKRIELFYLASKLDPTSFLFLLPLDIFRAIFEGHFYLGSGHQKCTTCTDQKEYLFGMLRGPKETSTPNQCCLQSCGCLSLHPEICIRQDFPQDMWGKWKFFDHKD